MYCWSSEQIQSSQGKDSLILLYSFLTIIFQNPQHQNVKSDFDYYHKSSEAKNQPTTSRLLKLSIRKFHHHIHLSSIIGTNWEILSLGRMTFNISFHIMILWRSWRLDRHSSLLIWPCIKPNQFVCSDLEGTQTKVYIFYSHGVMGMFKIRSLIYFHENWQPLPLYSIQNHQRS